MYPQVNFPKKVTEKWLNRAFAPLSDYLEREHPNVARTIMSYMMFMVNEEQKFYYRNGITKGHIVLDQLGLLVSCDKDALQYEFDWPKGTTASSWNEEYFIHPNVTNWMKKHLRAKQERKYGQEIRLFLQEYWGPIVNFDFDNLKVGYPLRGASLPYCLYLYPTKFPTLIAFQFVGDEIVDNSCNVSQYYQYKEHESKLIYKGWHVVTIIREILNDDPDLFHLYLSKAIELGLPRDLVYALAETGRNPL